MSTAVTRRGIAAGLIMALAGAICFSTKAIFVKLAYRDTSADAVTLLALRMVFSLPFFLASAFISSGKADNVRFTTRQWIYVAGIGCLGYYVSSMLDFVGLQYISAGIERLILFVYPTLVLLLGAMLFRTKITRRQWLAVAITYLGLLLAFYGEVNLSYTRHDQFWYGAILIFVCAITYALYIVGSGKMIPVIGAAKFNSYAMTFACIAVLVHFLVAGSQSLFSLEPLVYGYCILMALLSTVIPSYLIAEGIKRIGSGNTAIVGSIGPVSTIAQAAIFLGEPVFALQIAGTVLVLAGVLLIGSRR